VSVWIIIEALFSKEIVTKFMAFAHLLVVCQPIFSTSKLWQWGYCFTVHKKTVTNIFQDVTQLKLPSSKNAMKLQIKVDNICGKV
jgi:hypothetical protein